MADAQKMMGRGGYNGTGATRDTVRGATELGAASSSDDVMAIMAFYTNLTSRWPGFSHLMQLPPPLLSLTLTVDRAPRGTPWLLRALAPTLGAQQP